MTASTPPPRLLSDHVPHPGRRLPRPRVDYTCRRPEGAHDAAAARSASPLFIPAGDNTSEEAKRTKPPLTEVPPPPPSPQTRVQLLRAELVLGQVEEEPCVEWDFDNSTFSSTVGTEVIFDSDRLVSGVGACDLAVTKFQLACGWEYLRSTYQSIYMFGVTIGAPFNGVLADRYGRKMTWPWVSSPTPPWPSAPAGSPTSRLSCSRALLMGAVHPTIQKTGYILGMEVADPKWRTHIGIVLFLPWALGLMAWGGFAYLVREWRMLQLTVSLLCLAFLPTLWFMDESPRWLAVRGQHRRALRVLQRAARWNGVALPPEDELLLLLKDGAMVRPHQDARAHTARGCLYTNYLLVVLLCTSGLSLSGGDLSSDPFLYMVLTGSWSCRPTRWSSPWWLANGRRAPVVRLFFMGAVLFLALALVPTGGIAATFTSSELFPSARVDWVGRDYETGDMSKQGLGSRMDV
ncbi:putative organic cation transporter protein-like [Penaeus vannamei]|uniref:Putative organic cation transporter protein-like n=1 Tax=Penaeus vannamei TaxID=6689 RepID=A0A3R7M798_PENVA|nr:putative organic cation transporter protein-like [Penaeus vannamei]